MEPNAPVYKFTPKHRWQVKLHFMSGITWSGLTALLKSHWTHIDWATYWHRVLFLAFMASINSCMGLIDWLLFGRAIARQELHPEPLIILGHPRTGTTHLHNLLSQDQRFAYLSIFQAGFPSSFIAMRPLRWLLGPMLDATRPMDNMALTWQLPAEDEIATCTLTGGISPYMAIVLPEQYRSHFRQYLPLDECDPRDLQAWRDAFMWTMKKVTYWAGGTKPLLIKSPVHTGRLKLLLRMFPRARFLYIHRHPMEVFPSAVNMADTYYWYTYLRQPSDRVMTDFILDQYEELYRLYCRDRGLVPPGRLLELSFRDLEEDPIAVLRRVYDAFGWDDFSAQLPVFRAYCSSLADFKKNQLSRPEGELERYVRARWAGSMRELGYS